MFGPTVSEMVSEYAVAMPMKATSQDIAHVCHPHPTRSEAVAVMAVEGWAVQA